MYLNKLSGEQKELFLDLCIHASLSNNDFDEIERSYISQYCEEMHIDTVRYTAKNDTDTAVKRLAEISSESEVKIVVFELMALILSDDVYDEMEQEFMNKVLAGLNVTREQNSRFADIIKELRLIYSKIDGLIFK